jgi:hypothetical protein
MEPTITLASLYTISKIIGSITTLFGIGYGVFKVISWVKSKFVNIDANVTALKNTMETGFNKLSEDIKSQTTIIASELKEQRQDFRTFYAPILMMQQMQQNPQVTAPARAKRSPRNKKK